VTAFFIGSVVGFLIDIFCSAIKRSVRRHGFHCCSSPLGEVRIPGRTAARAHFVVINKGAWQFYLSYVAGVSAKTAKGYF